MGRASFRKGGCIFTVRLFARLPLLILVQLGALRAYILLDERNIPPLGRIGDPDDIIASVRVEDGKVSFTAIDIDTAALRASGCSS